MILDECLRMWLSSNGVCISKIWKEHIQNTISILHWGWITPAFTPKQAYFAINTKLWQVKDGLQIYNQPVKYSAGSK
jgi:hypothetical protein